MRLVGLAVLAIVLSALPDHGVAATTGVVLGDSLGVGVALASGLRGLAHDSVHIRGQRALEQINAAPAGSTAFVVLGSNDAEEGIKGLDPSIDAFVQAAARRDIRLVWLGPTCARKPWNTRVYELDQVLQQRFAGSPVTYVSMLDETICSGTFFEPDGVHLTQKGYAYMWEKARAVAGFVPAEADLAPKAAAGVSRPKSAGRHDSHRKHLHHVARHAPPRSVVPLSGRRQATN